ncbi:MAG TPA: hypothetical protein VGJ39_01815 [Vicinamibacterales bacterium]|jgi:hypothetical protein
MKEISIGTVSYRILATGRDGQFVARAERADTGDRFGIECTGPSADEAVNRLSHWLEWQHEHSAALEELQRAEHAYHRTIAGSAFASPTEGPSAVEMQKESLEVVEAARLRLDEIRARRPEPQ